MFEEITYEQILNRMLERVPQELDRREGSILYTALAPAAAELRQMYIEADVILNETFADTATRPYLIRRAAERGITPKSASAAWVKGIFNRSVAIGSRFSLEELNFVVVEPIEDQGAEHVYKLQCETEGQAGNRYLGAMIPIDYIAGLTSAVATELIIPGEDEEGTESIRSRYFASLDAQAFGGNQADYREKVMRIPGIGGVKVYPVWNGGGTVKLVIQNSQYAQPSNELVAEVQQLVDPLEEQGEGNGFAPIGHLVTVEGVVSTSIDCSFQITYESGWTWGDVEAYVNAAIDQYFLELNQSWADSQQLIVRISQLESRLLSLPGILDLAGTTINGLEENFLLEENSIPVRGDVSG